MKMWGLAIISLGGVLIMSSQIQVNQNPLIITGLSLILVGVFMYKKGKK